MNKILVISLDKRFKKFERKVKNTALKILKILKKTNVSLEIYLVNSQKMRFLNKKFRGQDKTTTVLSFEEPRNFILPPSKFKRIGEIYLNLTNDLRLATNDRRKLSVVSCRLLVHGLLHLLGYNHQKKSDRIRMERKERKLLKFLITNS